MQVPSPISDAHLSTTNERGENEGTNERERHFQRLSILSIGSHEALPLHHLTTITTITSRPVTTTDRVFVFVLIIFISSSSLLHPHPSPANGRTDAQLGHSLARSRALLLALLASVIDSSLLKCNAPASAAAAANCQ